MDVDTCIISLKIIAGLQVGQRLNSTENYINIEPSSIIPEFVRRWKRNDSRQQTFRILNIILNNSIHHHQKGHLNKRYLEEAIDGLHNLQSTYTIDPLMVSKIDTLIDKVISVINLPEDF